MVVSRQLTAAVKMLLVLTLLGGVLYPAAITLVGLAVPDRANGSLVRVEGSVVGSSLLGQAADGPQWFQARPSASRHAGDASGGSNLGPSAAELAATVSKRTAALRAANPHAPASIPPDALTASASGLDPHISPDYARWQAPRIARATGIPLESLLEIIGAHTEGPALGFIGTDRVNVTELNAFLAAARTVAAGR
ncbi:MAG: potassium-transporting ATPase subunit KdpC [Dermatophilaceae bacterium]